MLNHIEKLVYFLAVAEAGSVRAASRQLGIAQPAISRAIKILEDEFKTELFTRHKNGVICTDAGNQTVAVAKKLIHVVEEFKAQLGTSGDLVAGRLRIGTFESLTIYLWPMIINKLERKYPSLSIDLLTNNGTVLRQQLVDGSVDMTVDVEPEPQAGIRSVVLYEDQYRFFVASGSGSERKESFTLEELKKKTTDLFTEGNVART